MSNDVIDLATFRELENAAGAEFVGELVDTFLQEAPRMLGDLRAALAAGDAEPFRRAAHSLKSNSITFGALELGAMARELELSAQDAVRTADVASLDLLAAEYVRVAAALGKLRHA